MRILFLTTEFPWPSRNGGTARTLSQLRVLASMPEVKSITVCSVTEAPLSPSRRDELEAHIPKVRAREPVFHPVHLWDFLHYVPNVIYQRARGFPYLAGKWASKRVERAIVKELRSDIIDVTYIDHLGMSFYVDVIRKARPSCHIVLEEHNVEADFFKQFYESRRTITQKLAAKIEWESAKSYEAKMLRAADGVIAISDVDAKELHQMSGVHCRVVPQVMPFTRRTADYCSDATACYIGSLRWRPNVAALNWLCQEVWPEVLKSVPEAKLLVSGEGLKQDPNGAVDVPREWQVPGVTCLGFVQDLPSIYQRATCSLAPTIGGAGVRIKVLEAMRSGMPLVVTSESITGLRAVHGDQILIGDDPKSFADNVVRLFREPELRARLRTRGYDYLDTHHTLARAREEMRPALGFAPGVTDEAKFA